MIDVETDGGVNASINMINVTGITLGGLLAFVAFNMTTIPCFAAVASAKGELPDKKLGATLLFWIVVSFIVSTTVYLVVDYVWTLAIIIPLFILVFVGIYLFNKYRDSKVATK